MLVLGSMIASLLRGKERALDGKQGSETVLHSIETKSDEGFGLGLVTRIGTHSGSEALASSKWKKARASHGRARGLGSRAAPAKPIWPAAAYFHALGSACA